MYPRNAASPQRIAIGPVVLISDGTVQTATVSVKVMPQGAAASAGLGTIAYEEGIVHYVPTQAETNYASLMLIAYKASCIPATVTVVTSASGVAGYAGLDWATINAATTAQGLTGTTIAASQVVASVTGAVGSVTGLTASDVGAIKAKTDALPAAPAAVGDIPTALQNADALLNRDMSAVSDTNARSPLNALRFLRNRWSISGTTLSVKKENDTIEAWTAVVTAAPGADPISGSDPA